MTDPIAVLVTGGAGYIGSHTCKALSQSGFLPVTIDNLVSGHRSAVKWGPLIEADLADSTVLKKAINEHAIRAVIHFAAYAYVGESMQVPGKYFANNVSNTINLLEAMREANLTHIVFSSTCATYGVPVALPITEDHPQRPVNPYGASKLFIEHALHWYEVAHRYRSVCLRYFNAAGADPDGEIGESHDPETHLIPLVIQTALGLRSSIDINGTDYDTPDGTAIRDYIHVTDLADAHVKALTHLLGGGPSLQLNLGTGCGHSVHEVIAAAAKHCSRKINSRACPRRNGDPARLVADPSRAKKILGWEPALSSLERILETAWSWHLQEADNHRKRTASKSSIVASTGQSG